MAPEVPVEGTVATAILQFIIEMTSIPSSTPHLFTVDVEEYFQVNAFEGIAARDQWDRYPSRVDESVDTLLELLDARAASGTFFTLGWLAHRRPELVRRIAAAGHEIASHGWWHRRVTTMSRDEFRADVRDAKAVLEDLSGAPVRGFRAPSFSIIPGYEWALDVLAEEGYAYDSSLFPVRRPGYGYATARTTPHTLNTAGGRLVEFPLATTTIAGARLPAAGGGYLRQLPFALTQRAFREHAKAGVPAVFYIHPWELDADQPRLPVSPLTRLRHYRGLDRTRGCIERLLAEFRFTSIASYLASETTPNLPAITLGSSPASGPVDVLSH